MTRVWALCATGLAIAALTGCSSMAPLEPMPVFPPEKRDVINVPLQVRPGHDLSDDVVQLAGHAVQRGSSVVINVPSSVIEASAKLDDTGQEFKTKDFFNVAEQQIERVFIGNGFRVISRSKFEAKLRDLRDAGRCDTSNYRCLYDQVAPEARPILDDLKAKFDANKITAMEYSQQIAQFKEKMQTASAGRNRKEDQRELTDISEVIRAAQAGDIQADYILQINVFDTQKQVRMTLDLHHEPKVRNFLATYPAVLPAFENGHDKISCTVYGAELNAKLIHVKTGEIVWIGSHELNEYSSGVQPIGVELGQRTYVANEKQIRDFVNLQNTDFMREQRSGRVLHLPPQEMHTDLIGPIVSSGRCEQKPKSDDETRALLARKVAYDLISTIRTGS